MGAFLLSKRGGSAMTIEQFLDIKIEMHKRKHKRYSFILKRTKRKRIKEKAELNIRIAVGMINNIEDIKAMRRG